VPEECGEGCTLIEHLPEFQTFAGRPKSRSLTAIRKQRGWVRDDSLTGTGDRAGGKSDEQMVKVCTNNGALWCYWHFRCCEMVVENVRICYPFAGEAFGLASRSRHANWEHLMSHMAAAGICTESEHP
jgi:hypothetical protein